MLTHVFHVEFGQVLCVLRLKPRGWQEGDHRDRAVWHQHEPGCLHAEGRGVGAGWWHIVSDVWLEFLSEENCGSVVGAGVRIEVSLNLSFCCHYKLGEFWNWIWFSFISKKRIGSWDTSYYTCCRFRDSTAIFHRNGNGKEKARFQTLCMQHCVSFVRWVLPCAVKMNS